MLVLEGRSVRVASLICCSKTRVLANTSCPFEIWFLGFAANFLLVIFTDLKAVHTIEPTHINCTFIIIEISTKFFPGSFSAQAYSKGGGGGRSLLT